jgi:glycosyltransferase involved in cell wall biosynthesis
MIATAFSSIDVDSTHAKMTPQTVVHIVQHLRPGGLECLVLDFLRFSPSHWDVRIISLEGNREEAIEQWPALAQFNNKTWFLNKTTRGISVRTISEIISYIKDEQVDAIHTHHIGPLLYAGIAAKLTGVKTTIHTEHDAWHLNSRKHRFIENLLLKVNKPILIADASEVQQALSSLFHYTDPRTIYNGIDTQRFTLGSPSRARRLLGLEQSSNKAVLIGSAGRLEAVKGQDTLIKSMKFLPKQFKLAIAGDGSQKESLHRLVKELGLQQRVRFLGRIDDMTSFYQSLDLFCLPSRHEGFPLSALEAQACGTHTIVTKVGASEQTLCPKTGRSVLPNRPIALAQAIQKSVIQQNEMTAEAIPNGDLDMPRQHVCTHYDIRTMIDHYQQLMINGSRQ